MKHILTTLLALICLWVISFVVWFTLESRAANYYSISSINYEMATMFLGVDDAKSKEYEKEAIDSRNIALSAQGNSKRLLTAISFGAK